MGDDVLGDLTATPLPLQRLQRISSTWRIFSFVVLLIFSIEFIEVESAIQS